MGERATGSKQQTAGDAYLQRESEGRVSEEGRGLQREVHGLQRQGQASQLADRTSHATIGPAGVI